MDIKNTILVTFGEALWDFLPSGKRPGGAPMNVALHLHRLKANVRFISRVGKDTDGEELLAYLESQGIDKKFVQTDEEHPTGVVQVKVAPDGDATYHIVEPVAWDFISYEPTLAQLGNYILVYGSLAARNATSKETLIKLIGKASFRALDLNFRAPFYSQQIIEELAVGADLIKMNWEEFELLKEWYHISAADEATALAEIGKRLSCPILCLTSGKQGAWLMQEGELHFQPAFKIKVVDTIGAGDAFLAAFLKSYTSGEAPQACLQYACAVGAFVAQKEGANPVYTEQDIHAMMQQS